MNVNDVRGRLALQSPLQIEVRGRRPLPSPQTSTTDYDSYTVNGIPRMYCQISGFLDCIVKNPLNALYKTRESPHAISKLL